MSIRRPELTTPEQRTVIARKVVELVDAVNRIDAEEVDLSDIETELTSLDTRVDALEALPTPANPVSLSGSRHEDQGGAFSAGNTRVHLAGVNSSSDAASGTSLFYSGATIAGIQGIGTGQVAYAYPERFERAVTINRLCTRTNGRSGPSAIGAMRIAVYAEGSLSSGSFSGSPYPGALLGESAGFSMVGAAANALYESVGLSISISAGQRVWFAIMFDDDAVTGNWSIPGYLWGTLFPILGFVWNVGATTIDQEDATRGVGWRHAVTFTGAQSFPNPFPQSSPVVCTTTHGTVNQPAVFFGQQIT